MKTPAKLKQLVPLMLVLIALLAPSAQAQTRIYPALPAPPQPTLSATVHWEAVPGTRVYMLRQGERPPYDMFNYGSQYYIYNNGYWYRATRAGGPYLAIDERNVPIAFNDVPEGEWMNYPGSADQMTGLGNGYSGSGQAPSPVPPRVYFRTRPHWVGIPGTRVSMIRSDERPNYDMFSSNGYVYVYDNGYWYRSDRLNGPYVLINETSVPVDIANVPQDEWIRYPAQWANNNFDNRYNRTDVNNAPLSTALPPAPRLTFRRAPHWVMVPGSSVAVIRGDERPAYDMFRLGSNYYIYNDGYWYRSNRWNGAYVYVEDRNVPTSFSSVPVNTWRNYPSDWASENNRNAWRNRHRSGYRR